MPLFNNGPTLNRRHLMAMSRSGHLLEDRHGFEVDEELLSDRHKMAFDDDRMVPYYELRQEGIPPVLMGYVHLYTGGDTPITKDDSWLLERAPAIYEQAANALQERKGLGLLANRKLGLFILGVGAAVMLLCLMIIGYGMKLDAAKEAMKTDAQAVEPAPDQDSQQEVQPAGAGTEEGAAGPATDTPPAEPAPAQPPQQEVQPAGAEGGTAGP